MLYTDILKISLNKKAIKDRIYIDEKNNKYIGGKDGRVSRVYGNNESIENQVELLTNEVDLLNNEVNSLETNITSLNDEIEIINNNVDSLNTEIDTKQDTLVSGTNIKTINGNSLLGSGNIVISGGGGGSGNSYFPSGW